MKTNTHSVATTHAAWIALCVAVGCGGPPKQVGSENDFTPPSVPATTGPDTTPPPSKPSSGGDGPTSRLNTMQKEQLDIALRRGGEKSAKCVDVVPDAPRGDGEVKVTFDGQKGRATEASVGAPFAGTPVEACIKRAFVGEIVLPFEGGPLEVPFTVKLPAKTSAADDKKAPPKKK
jgi:hypothetical protein